MIDHWVISLSSKSVQIYGEIHRKIWPTEVHLWSFSIFVLPDIIETVVELWLTPCKTPKLWEPSNLMRVLSMFTIGHDLQPA